MFLLPPWLDADSLDEFISMRNRIKKPLTPRALTRLIHRLEALRAAGHDPNAALIQSADHYWQDVYAPKDMTIARASGSGVSETKVLLAQMEADRLASQTPQAQAAKQRAIELVRGVVKRVA